LASRARTDPSGDNVRLPGAVTARRGRGGAVTIPRVDGTEPSSARDFDADESLLTEVLDEVVRRSNGEAALELHNRAVGLSREALNIPGTAADRLAALVAELDLDHSEVLVRSLTRWFQLANLAEDNDRVRRLRRRDLEEAPAPRRGSMREAIARLARRGVSAW
jgi:phosphoenolpyruvate carboxylase